MALNIRPHPPDRKQAKEESDDDCKIMFFKD